MSIVYSFNIYSADFSSICMDISVNNNKDVRAILMFIYNVGRVHRSVRCSVQQIVSLPQTTSQSRSFLRVT